MTDRRLTTRAILDQESTLQRWAERHVSHAPINRTDPAAAATAAIAGRHRLGLVVGPAGTGKTTATARAVRNLQTRRRAVVALAPSGKAADVLADEAGCSTATLASFLSSEDGSRPSRWPQDATVIVDEAGMAATDDLARLVALAERQRWRIVLVGDPGQLPAVGRGGLFAHWYDTLPHHDLEQPRRFREDWEGPASLALRAGDPAAAAAYDEHGRLATVHPALLAERVADRYDRHVQAGQEVAITTSTAETARRINRAIQQRTPTRGPAVHLHDGTEVRAGDRIATRRNNPDLRTDSGQPVRNRQTWTVAAVDRDGGLHLHDPGRGSARLPAGYVAQHVELGWAVTGYGNQGDTVDVGIAVLEPGTSRNHTYVALTRGRHLNVALVEDASGTATAADSLAAIIDRSPRAESALAVSDRLRRETREVPPPGDGTLAVPAVDGDSVVTLRLVQARRLGGLTRSP